MADQPLARVFSRSTRYRQSIDSARELRKEAERLLALSRQLLADARAALEEEQRELLAGIKAVPGLKIDPALIISAVARAYRIDVAQLKSQSRAQHVAFARQVAMYLVRHITSVSFPRVASYFARDHSTVIHAHRLVAVRKADNAAFALAIDRLEAEIREVAAAGEVAAASEDCEAAFKEVAA
ncbi:MAG TPA: helix-turn-helix domain-containing protein [Candidatus Binataceae bacterium]|nr:helix-turn-helix domain-containing protein [Candidatus Binataceae bacterium]